MPPARTRPSPFVPASSFTAASIVSGASYRIRFPFPYLEFSFPEPGAGRRPYAEMLNAFLGMVRHPGDTHHTVSLIRP